MASPSPALIVLPPVPAAHVDFISHVANRRGTPIPKLLEPYNQYDAQLRKIFAQQPHHPTVSDPHVNVVPIFAGQEGSLRVRCRDLNEESEHERASYIMPLSKEDRKSEGLPAVVNTLKEFQTNFALFSESSLVDMDWSNVVVAGSAVVSALLPVPERYNKSKRALREYYHQRLAPASDVDLFLYGLDEEAAVEKIKQIEQRIRDSILTETTSIRTKNTITIASQFPTRHVQIVLRIYKSVAEILTGFDVDCSCAAYDGKQVWASPRAIGAYMTQINTIDLTRRSPSYENRLSKYSHRGFEVYWPLLDRSRIDPTIFERSFGRTVGLARLLVYERLPKNTDRDAYLDQRRSERGRPPINRWHMDARGLKGNVKDNHEDEVAEWVEADEVSDYHTFTVPYGPKFHAKNIEKLLYSKDLLLNAEWNKPKDREVNLHRHPAFFGSVKDVIQDCCEYCPKPKTPEEEKVAEEESKIYISGDMKFIQDNPGRQAIGSFNPITDDDWTEMAYVGNTARLCQAIVDGDLEHVRDWLSQGGSDPNRRDYTGRTPLHLAVMCSTVEIVQTLVDQGARIVARLVDGKTALHLAAIRGDVAMVSALLRKSEANEEEEAKKDEKRKEARRAAKVQASADAGTTAAAASEIRFDVERSTLTRHDGESEDDEMDMVNNTEEDEDDDEGVDAITDNSFVKVKPRAEVDDNTLDDTDKDQPDVYDVNVLAWDTPISALHLAIVNGHQELVKILVQEFGADVRLPVKLFHDYSRSPRAAILTLVLASQLPLEQAKAMCKTLIELGASAAQADMDQTTSLHFCVITSPGVIDTLMEADLPAARRALNHLSITGYEHSCEVKSPLVTAIQVRDSVTALRLLEEGADTQIAFGPFMKSYQTRFEARGDPGRLKEIFQKCVKQPILVAIETELPSIAMELMSRGADVNALTTDGWILLIYRHDRESDDEGSVLDTVRNKLQKLREYDGEKEPHDSPTPLNGDEAYLATYKKGTYAHWTACKLLQHAKKEYENRLEQYNSQIKAAEARRGLAKKKHEVDATVRAYEELEKHLIERGAKSFTELNPDIKDLTELHRYKDSVNSRNPKPFEVEWSFRVPGLTDERHAAYIELFEAAWSGNLEGVKTKTLGLWGPENDMVPLKIAVQDSNNFSPFAIAVLRGDLNIAQAILDIAQAQYCGPEDADRKRYTLRSGTDDDGDSQRSQPLFYHLTKELFDKEGEFQDREGEFHIHSEIIDDQFTIENIGELSAQVKSNVTPRQMLSWACPVTRYLDDGDLSTTQSSSSNFPREPGTSTGGRPPRKRLGASPPGKRQAAPATVLREQVEDPKNLMQMAIFQNNHALLNFMFDMNMRYTPYTPDTQPLDSSDPFAFDTTDWNYAVKLGRTELLGEIIKRTGAGMPLETLIKAAGVDIKEKPKFYQGLSIHGKKRKDWAQAGRKAVQHTKHADPPLLYSAFSGSLESVEWFSGDTPKRCYQEFAAAHKDDKRLQHAELAHGGLDKMITSWLSTRSDLVIHCAILSKPSERSLRLLEYLIETRPYCVDAKSASGLTPLQLAFSLHQLEMARALIDAGADQTCRDMAGNNIVHSALYRVGSGESVEPSILESILGLIDRRLLSSLFTERSSASPGSVTPLAYWLSQLVTESRGRYPQDRAPDEKAENEDAQAMRTILRFSEGAELDMINGGGDTPLHVAIRFGMPKLVDVILQHDPALLLKENATGRTPLEVAEDAHLGQFFADPPSLPGRYCARYKFGCYQTSPVSNIQNRSSESFVEDPKEERNGTERVWEICCRVKSEVARSAKKRKLVSLFEANEVAKRLAARNANQHVSTQSADDDDDDDDDSNAGEEKGHKRVKDEVDSWFWTAFRY
ncbi:hypothetical protein LTR66_001674 [Elasticomyces elasticus]|nr:hypothetical protein LTR66_001674 [Elasticomyces elasticus]